MNTNLSINWVSKEALTHEDAQDVIEVCEIINPVIEEILELKDLNGLGDNIENRNFLIYYIYGLEYKVHKVFKYDDSKEEEENRDIFNQNVSCLREWAIEQLFEINMK